MKILVSSVNKLNKRNIHNKKLQCSQHLSFQSYGFLQYSTDITSLEARPGWRLRPSLSGQNHQSPFLCPHYLVCILILLADSRRYVHGGRSEGGDNCSTGQVVVKKIPIELLGVFLQVPLASKLSGSQSSCGGLPCRKYDLAVR